MDIDKDIDKDVDIDIRKSRCTGGRGKKCGFFFFFFGYSRDPSLFWSFSFSTKRYLNYSIFETSIYR